MGCAVPVPVFTNIPISTSTLQRRLEMWLSPHSRAAAHLRAGSSRTCAEWLLTSEARASAGAAASMWHKACTQSFFSLLKKSAKKVHTSLRAVMQGTCCFSPAIVWLFAGLVSSPSGNICYSVNARKLWDEKQARTLESKCWAVSMRLNHVILWFHSKFSFLPFFLSF